jgi:hypothetical protein
MIAIILAGEPSDSGPGEYSDMKTPHPNLSPGTGRGKTADLSPWTPAGSALLAVW